ncbi:MAG: hypothetical protein BroJett011_07430 [Chloroflexota bacterium]|nr:MAG: hypothetical protein BroJett011_07430 [Chloroflexota bacterium]
MSLNAEVNLRTVVETFAPEEDIHHALFLTYGFDGEMIEDAERGPLEMIWWRNCENILVLRDGKAVLTEKQSHRYSVINAAYSRRTFHPKLMLLLTPSEVLVGLGSANLTRGGLENNLELVNIYRLTRSSGPFTFFQSVREYLGKDYLQRELTATSNQQRAAFELLCRDFDRFLAEVKVARPPVEPLFLHNYDQPLWPQIVQALPGKKLEMVWIVSPFFEADTSQPLSSGGSSSPTGAAHHEDPLQDGLDETLFKQLFTTFDFKQSKVQFPIRIYFQASSTNVTNLPLNQLQPFKSQIALFKKDPGAIDPRHLHAKLFVFIGRHQDGKLFITLVHGSANCTRAALLSQPPEGNAEIVVLTHLPQPEGLVEKLETFLNLRQLFTPVHNWASLTSQSPPSPLPLPSILVWEGLVSISKKTVTIFFQVDHPQAHRATFTLQGEPFELPLGEIAAPFPESYQFSLPKAAITLVDAERGLQQLLYRSVRVEIFDAKHQSLGWAEGPLNVDCPTAFIGNKLLDSLWQNTVDTQIYLAGLGNLAGYAVWRDQVDRTPSTKNSARTAPTHQANLDLFFRRLHLGFRGLRQRIEQAQGSLYIYGDTLRRLAQWAQQVVEEQDQYTPEQQLYLCQRIVQTVRECTGVLKQAKQRPEAVASILSEEFLAKAVLLQNYATSLCQDEHLGTAAENLLNQWSLLESELRKAKP